MFDQMVMAGGGGRCTWQVGFLDVVTPALELKPRVISTVSAGGLMSCLMFTQETRATLDYIHTLFGANAKNIYWANLFREQRVFPQHAMYLQAMRDLFADRLDRLKDAPEIRIGVTHIPKWLGVYPSMALAIAAYSFDKHVRKALHPTTARAIGFQQQFRSAQDCSSVEELAELILQSSCTPPIIPMMHVQGKAILDGGVVDNIPTAGLDPTTEPVLVLLSRMYADRPTQFSVNHHGQKRLYVQPSSPIPVKSWDYTRPDLIEETFQLGRRDGLQFLKDFEGLI